MHTSTAVYPNRVADKERVERSYPSLLEFGNSNTKFFSDDVLIAESYERVVYGDHGPYVEFKKEQLKVVLKSHFDQEIPEELPPEFYVNFYYYWLEPVIVPKIKIYWQIKPVSDKKNAPKRDDGKKSNFNRKEGYADYKRGFYYISPYQFAIIRV